MTTLILEPELLYFNTLAYSGLLLTIALIFYHMTKFNTLEMHYIASSIFAIVIIFISIIYLIMGTISYYHRLNQLIKENQINLKRENQNFIIYFILGIILITIQCSIAYVILVNIFKK